MTLVRGGGGHGRIFGIGGYDAVVGGGLLCATERDELIVGLEPLTGAELHHVAGAVPVGLSVGWVLGAWHR